MYWKKRISHFPPSKNALMDKNGVVLGEMGVESTYQTAPAHVVPLLFSNMYCCHMMNSILNAIQDLGVGRCTVLCQSVDVE